MTPLTSVRPRESGGMYPELILMQHGRQPQVFLSIPQNHSLLPAANSASVPTTDMNQSIWFLPDGSERIRSVGLNNSPLGCKKNSSPISSWLMQTSFIKCIDVSALISTQSNCSEERTFFPGKLPPALPYIFNTTSQPGSGTMQLKVASYQWLPSRKARGWCLSEDGMAVREG